MVSIPFKRDSSSELRTIVNSQSESLITMFQFPSNGIVVPNQKWRPTAFNDVVVSIPFKRDSSSELLCTTQKNVGVI